jgi:hypothetical protein
VELRQTGISQGKERGYREPTPPADSPASAMLPGSTPCADSHGARVRTSALDEGDAALDRAAAFLKEQLGVTQPTARDGEGRKNEQ